MSRFRIYCVIFLLSLLPFIFVFTSTQLPKTHDGEVHLARMAAYYKALSDGQLLPRWAGDLNFGYGMPLFNFIYHTPYLVSSVFLSVGVNLSLTFKIVLFLSFLLSGIFMYELSRKLFSDHNSALVATTLYQFAPFRFIELFIRGSFGEIYTYTLLPCILLGVTVLAREPYRFRYVILTAVSTAALIISHNSVSLTFFVLSALFALCLTQSIHRLAILGSSLATGLTLAGFFWIPAILEHKYTYGNIFMKDMFRDHFPPLWQFLVPNLTNDGRLHTGGIAIFPGLVHIVSLLAVVYHWLASHYKKSTHKELSLFVVIATGIALFFMTQLSYPLWTNISLLRQFQFPWRFLSVFVLTTSLAGALLIGPHSPRKWVAFVVGLTIVTSAWYWKPTGYMEPISEELYWNYPYTSTYYGETDTIWSAGPAKDYPTDVIKVIDGTAVISDYTKRSSWHSYSVEATRDVTVADQTQYFPGWRVYVDREKVPIEFQDQNWRGILTYKIPAGTHNVRVSFEDSKPRFIGEGLTLVSALIILILSFVSKAKKKL